MTLRILAWAAWKLARARRRLRVILWLRYDLWPVCISCGRSPRACRCTGGPHLEIECTCYEIFAGHQPGCPAGARVRS